MVGWWSQRGIAEVWRDSAMMSSQMETSGFIACYWAWRRFGRDLLLLWLSFNKSFAHMCVSMNGKTVRCYWWTPNLDTKLGHRGVETFVLLWNFFWRWMWPRLISYYCTQAQYHHRCYLLCWTSPCMKVKSLLIKEKQVFKPDWQQQWLRRRLIHPCSMGTSVDMASIIFLVHIKGIHYLYLSIRADIQEPPDMKTKHWWWQ